jgi:hypothetical protein
MDVTKINIKNFQMFSQAGNKACHGLVKRGARKIESKKRYTFEEYVDWLSAEVKKISEKHGEIYDTEPRGTIEHYLTAVADANGYDWNLNWEIR